MQGLVPILISAVVIITGACIVMILGWGVRNVLQGKVSPVTAGILAIPVVTIGVLGLAVSETWPEAFITGVLIMLVLTAGSLLISSIRMMLGL